MGHNERSGKRRRSAESDRRRSGSSSESARRNRRGGRRHDSSSRNESDGRSNPHRKSHRGHRSASISSRSSSSSSSSSMFSSFSDSFTSSSSSSSSSSRSGRTGGRRGKESKDRSGVLSSAVFPGDATTSNARPILSDSGSSHYGDYASRPQKGILDFAHIQGASGILGDLHSSSSDVAPIFAETVDSGVLQQDGGYDQPIIQYPTEDWMCGICSNLNSVKRQECYRCGADYVTAIVSQPCEELKLEMDHGYNAAAADGGKSVDEMSFVRGFESLFAARQETCKIVDVVVKRMFSRPVGILQRTGETQEADFVAAYVRFPTVDMARLALILCKCRLELNGGETVVSVQFSREQQTLESGSKEFLEKVASLGGLVSCVAVKCGAEQPGTSASKLRNPELPADLQHSSWSAPEQFETTEKEKEYLERLSAHWKHLSVDQRRFYEARVRLVLKAKASAAPAAIPSSFTTSKTAETSTSPSGAVADEEGAAAPQGKVSLDSLKKRLEEKKKKMELSAMAVGAVGTKSSAAAEKGNSSAVVGSSPSPPASKAGSLLAQRLAEKKARLLQQKANDAGGEKSNETVGTNDAQSLASPAQGKESSLSGKACENEHHDSPTSKSFYHFPVPPSLHSHGVYGKDYDIAMVFQYVPEAVFQHIIPPPK